MRTFASTWRRAVLVAAAIAVIPATAEANNRYPHGGGGSVRSGGGGAVRSGGSGAVRYGGGVRTGNPYPGGGGGLHWSGGVHYGGGYHSGTGYYTPRFRSWYSPRFYYGYYPSWYGGYYSYYPSATAYYYGDTGSAPPPAGAPVAAPGYAGAPAPMGVAMAAPAPQYNFGLGVRASSISLGSGKPNAQGLGLVGRFHGSIDLELELGQDKYDSSTRKDTRLGAGLLVPISHGQFEPYLVVAAGVNLISFDGSTATSTDSFKQGYLQGGGGLALHFGRFEVAGDLRYGVRHVLDSGTQSALQVVNTAAPDDKETALEGRISALFYF